MGPTTKSLTLRGDVTFQQLRDSYYEQAKALVEGGVDFLLFETGFDTRNVKSGLVASALEGIWAIDSGDGVGHGGTLGGDARRSTCRCFLRFRGPRQTFWRSV